MENLNIEKFNPTKAELLVMADKYKNLIIKGVDDKEGYLAVFQARQELKKARVNLKKNGKFAREEALKYQKAVISLENELVGIIEPLEKELQQKQEVIDEENARAKRVKDLPERMERLKLIETEASPDELLSMDDNQFLEFFNNKKMEYLEKKEQAIKVEAERKERERLLDEQDKETKRRMAEDERLAKQNKIEAERLLKIEKEERERQALIRAENEKLEMERIRIKAEADKIEAEKKRIADEAIKAEREKQRLIELEAAKKKAAEDEAKRIEAARLAKEAEAKRVKEELEKQAKYQNFLKDNKFDPLTDKIDQSGNKITLYRKIAEIII